MVHLLLLISPLIFSLYLYLPRSLSLFRVCSIYSIYFSNDLYSFPFVLNLLSSFFFAVDSWDGIGVMTTNRMIVML